MGRREVSQEVEVLAPPVSLEPRNRNHRDIDSQVTVQQTPLVNLSFESVNSSLYLRLSHFPSCNKQPDAFDCSFILLSRLQELSGLLYLHFQLSYFRLNFAQPINTFFHR
jgi:hypothetical protein